MIVDREDAEFTQAIVLINRRGTDDPDAYVRRELDEGGPNASPGPEDDDRLPRPNPCAAPQHSPCGNPVHHNGFGIDRRQLCNWANGWRR